MALATPLHRQHRSSRASALPTLWLAGPALGAQSLEATEVLGPPSANISAAVDVDALMAAVDRERARLEADERVVFLLGHEAATAWAISRGPARSRAFAVDPTLGPTAGAWRCRPSSATERGAPSTRPHLHLTTTAAARDAHRRRVADCQAFLRDGVIYQANLAHRLSVEFVDVEAGRAFFAASVVNEVPACAALLDFPDWGSIVSLSPERFVEGHLAGPLRPGLVRTYPVKGTLPRGVDSDDDERQWQRLRASTKDQAEHVMIVDLLRNDLGRVAEVGGVTVETLMGPLRTKNVHHLESVISARLRDDVGGADLMRACAPGGSITGAPKSSSVEVIAALEDGPRGAYTGILGVVDSVGAIQTSLLIRTWLRPNEGAGALHVGGGIVVDSDPEAEWQETLDKARIFGEVRVEG